MDHSDRLLAGRYRLPAPVGTQDLDDPVEAEDTFSGQRVQLERIPLPETASPRPDEPATPPADDSAVRHAMAAVRALARLPDHHSLGQVFDVFLEEGDRALWVVEELVTAKPMSDMIVGDQVLSPYQAAEIASDLLPALRALHLRGWIHRRITARTVLIQDDGRAMLCGLARSVVDEALCGYAARPLAPTGPSAPLPDAAKPATATGYHPAPRSTNRSAVSRSASGTRFGDALRADAQRAVPHHQRDPGPPTDGGDAERGAHSWPPGPATVLAARRARQVRALRVEHIVERWAPEQAASVPNTWQMLPPVGPPTDCWAVGALLYRATHGHAPYPEDGDDDLLDVVCQEPPAFAEECGPLRPVIESLLRQDPARRPTTIVAERWLRTLLRDAPEPHHEQDSVLLPVLRSRGHLEHQRPPARSAPRRRHGITVRGRLFFVAVSAALAMAAAYAATPQPAPSHADTRRAPSTTPAPFRPDGTSPPTRQDKSFDPTRLRISVGDGWARRYEPAHQRVRYTRGGLTILIVPGRDSIDRHGGDPLAYQAVLPELAQYRNDFEGRSAGVRRVTIGHNSRAEGRYTWTGSEGRRVHAWNTVLVFHGRFHIILAMGSADQTADVAAVHRQAVTSYRPPGAS
ncbi:protein kinase [Streptomyces sp. CFMR 7]|uniref:protein kinase n=1 Tax=Streptomyces sp. CFMR 7 TaxID=1649184 RepID=UPI0011A8D89C|nr:protein kinase [Streptomyces sp. CFMR 7]